MINPTKKLKAALGILTAVFAISVGSTAFAGEGEISDADLREIHGFDLNNASPLDWQRSTPQLTENGFTFIKDPTSSPYKPEYLYIIGGTEYRANNTGGLSKLTGTQRVAVYAACKRQTGSACEFMEPEPKDVVESTNDNVANEYVQDGGMALKLFNFAMGGSDGTANSCITCTFLASFMIALANFSASTFLYMQKAFSLIVPVIMMTWIGWKAAALFVTGGEDGKSFIYSILSKLAIFFMIWSVVSISESSKDTNGTGANIPAYAWNLSGPTYLGFAFGLSSEIRNNTIANASVVSNVSLQSSISAFQCNRTVDFMNKLTDQSEIASFAAKALDVACTNERSHIIGIASGVSLISSAGEQFSVKNAIPSVVKLITGFFMIVVFGLSMIWFTFLVLDVVVRAMITAAFSPIIAACYIWQPTRYVATTAFKGMIGGILTAVALGIVGTLAMFLLTNTVNVYNSLYPGLQGTYDNVVMEPIADGNAVIQFQEFLVRIQRSGNDTPQIPMDMSTPWFYYLVLSGLAIFSLGKKIVTMLENLVGAQGMSTMADNAMKLTKSGASLGMMAGGMTAAGLAMTAKGGAVGLTAGTSGLAEFYKNTASPFSGAGNAMEKANQAANTLLDGGIEQ